MNEIEEAIALLESDLVWSDDFEVIRLALIDVLYHANQRVDNEPESHLANLIIGEDNG